MDGRKSLLGELITERLVVSSDVVNQVPESNQVIDSPLATSEGIRKYSQWGRVLT